MNLVSKLVSMGAVAASGLVASKIATTGWTKLTGAEPPQDDEGQDRLLQVLVFAALSATLAALIQHFAVRGTTELLEKTRALRDNPDSVRDSE